MKVGAHVSTAGGLYKAIDRAAGIGAETIQIFASSPRAWAFKSPSEASVASFRERAEKEGIGPIFLHAIYLVNVGGAPDLVERSIESLVSHMSVASQIGASGVIFHAGSHKGVGFDGALPQAAGALGQVLSRSPSDVCLIVENSAGMGHHIGASFQEISRLIAAVDSARLMVCLDTQHALAAGYDMGRAEGLDAALDEFDREIGLSRLVAVHANDSKMELGSGVDRHENIGQGGIGVAGFETIMGNAAFRDVPFLLEVPGGDGSGPDKHNVEQLKAIRSRLKISA